jgi:hypothetical protein
MPNWLLRSGSSFYGFDVVADRFVPAVRLASKIERIEPQPPL